MKSADGAARVAMLLSNPATYDERPLKEAHTLAKAGHRVTIFAWDRESATSRDTVYPDGVTVRRMRLHAGHGTPYWTVPKLLVFYGWCLAHLLTTSFDVVHCHDVDTLPAGLAAKTLRLNRVRMVYDLHDLPEAFLRSFPLAKTAQGVFLSVCRKAADLVVVASDGFLEHLRGLGFEETRLVSVLNAPPLDHGRPPGKRSGPLDVLYYGGLEEERGVRLLVEGTDGLDGVTLTVAGRGSLADYVRSMSSRSSTLKFLGWLGPKDLRAQVEKADLIPSLYRPTTDNIRLSTPGKLLTSLSLSIPVLVPRGTFQEKVVMEFGCGLAVKWGDPEALRRALREIANDVTLREKLSAAAYGAFKEKLNWEAMQARLIGSYETILRPH